jgi:nicotinamidase-related amidase
VRDVVLLVDVFSAFDHDGGDDLLRSFRARFDGLERLVDRARAADVPIVYANDNVGVWDGDAPGLVAHALEGPGGDLLQRVRPRPEDAFVFKPRYSAFDLTPLALVLDGLGAERMVLAGAATEMCVAQTAIDAREQGLKVTVVTDACASVDAELEQVALRYLLDVAGARLATSEQWLEDA